MPVVVMIIVWDLLHNIHVSCVVASQVDRVRFAAFVALSRYADLVLLQNLVGFAAMSEHSA